MKKFIIINGTEMFITNKKSLKEANETAVKVCDNSKEIIVREVTEITDFTKHKIEDQWKQRLMY